MEKRIREYEKFIKTETSKNLSDKELDNLRHYHEEMMNNFQRERVCHLLVTFFFVIMTLVTLGITANFYYSYCFICIPKYIVILSSVLTLLLVLMSFFYIKHYYFLENHVQELYKYNKKIFNKK